MYKLTKTTSIIRLADGSCIPADPRNPGYKSYLEWVAAGNTPEPALSASQLEAEASDMAKRVLKEIDAASVRAIREWIVAQPTAPQLLKDREAAAVAERVKVK